MLYVWRYKLCKAFLTKNAFSWDGVLFQATFPNFMPARNRATWSACSGLLNK